MVGEVPKTATGKFEIVVTYDPEVDAAYIYLRPSLTDGERKAAVVRTAAVDSERLNGSVTLDYTKNDKMILGLEVLNASAHLHPDVLALAKKET